MTKPMALVVDDEADIRELLKMTLTRMSIEVYDAEDLQQAKSLLRDHDFALCLTDMRLPDGNGIELVEHVQHHYGHIPIAVITAYGNMEGAIDALKAGAFDYVSKPVNLDMLRELIKTTLQLHVKSTAYKRTTPLVGQASAMQALNKQITKVARSQAPVYISGDSGTGKELVARLIHQQSPRADKSFVPVNCGAIPNELMESEFFGHKKGSFTGAVADKQGLFQAAQGGTLFLDEVADLPLAMQVKLLRAIQEKAVRAVGALEETAIDVRVVSATHKQLEQLVATGNFRQDLFYRINVIGLRVPSLQERVEDIPLLVDHILSRLANEQHLPPTSLSQECMRALKDYHFPGNIRELENMLERAMTLCEGDVITEADLQLPSSDSFEQEQTSQLSLVSYLDSKEKEAIIAALEKTRWNKTAAAKLLGISFRALRYRVEKLGLEH